MIVNYTSNILTGLQLEEPGKGKQLVRQLVRKLLNTDDCALVADTEEEAQVLIYCFHKTTTRSLHIHKEN